MKAGDFVTVDEHQRCLACGQSCLGLQASPPSDDDKIHHPKHYTQGIECWDYIVSHGMGYLEGNIIKYVTRYKDKGGIEDLLKAKAYLTRLIEAVQGAKARKGESQNGD